MHSQAQWVVFSAPRAEIVRMATRAFKWDVPREWARKMLEKSTAQYGLDFENEDVAPVNSYTFEITDGMVVTAVTMRSGSKVLEDFAFLEQFIPVACKFIVCATMPR